MKVINFCDIAFLIGNTVLKIKFFFQFFIIVLLFVATFVIAGFFGSANLNPSDIVTILKHKIFGTALIGVDKNAVAIVWALRIPRALLAIAIGGGLAISGAAMQAITQNVLADPYILGVSSGALVGVSAVCYFFPYHPKLPILMSIASFIGATLSHMIVNRTANMGKNTANGKLILAGMSINIVLTALSHYFIMSTDDINSTRNIVSWMMGSLAQARWHNIFLFMIVIVGASFYFVIKARDFDLISLGDGSALALGINAHKLKREAVVIVSLIAAMCVASAGMIGLVGFLVPHSVRMIMGGEHRKLFPISFVIGACFLMWMDILSRTLIAPRELPIGIFTALFGGPFFIWILLHKR